METQPQKETASADGGKSISNGLLSFSNWKSVDDCLPAKGCSVLVDGPEWPTYMVAIYDGQDKNFPWLVYHGHENERFAHDAFDYWQELPWMIER